MKVFDLSYKKIIKDALWDNNPGLVQLLGLCPLLAVTNSAVNSIGLGLATLLVLMLSNFAVSLLKNIIPKPIRIAIFVIIIASLVTVIQIFMNAYLHELYLSLGIFLPLIVTNCVIIGRAESFASRNSVFKSTLDGFMMGLGFMLVLLLLGLLREFLGSGAIFVGASALFGAWGDLLELRLIDFNNELLIAILPPGAFFAMAFLIALKNYINNIASARKTQSHVEIKRARVTGKL